MIKLFENKDINELKNFGWKKIEDPENIRYKRDISSIIPDSFLEVTETQDFENSRFVRAYRHNKEFDENSRYWSLVLLSVTAELKSSLMENRPKRIKRKVTIG